MTDGAIIQRGRFELVAGYARKEWLRHGGLALVMLLTGLGFGSYAAYRTHALLDQARVWNDGVESSEEVGYGGEVVTHQHLLKVYDLKVTFFPDDADEPVTFEASFNRFASGPDEGDPMTVKYDPNMPEHAVCSWQYEARWHGWSLTGFCWFIALCGVLVFFVVVRDTARTVAKVTAMAQEGQLMRAQVDEAKPGGTDQTPLMIVRYRTARGEPQKQTFFLKHGEPYLLNQGKEVLVLTTFNERSSHALRADGYPLATRPQLEEAP